MTEISPAHAADPLASTHFDSMREDILLQPVTGRAIPIRRGEVLRIIQEVGGQCVDFNAFNLHDYKEHLDVGRTRLFAGMFPTAGNFLYTNSPRDRAMFAILAMPSTCRAETLGSRCHAMLFERIFGYSAHTNCQDTLAECIGAYGLTPDDVHDSFNMWMNTEITDTGEMTINHNTGKRGDAVDLLSVFDTLAVPIVCGSGDVFNTSNFWLKPIRVQVFSATASTLAAVDHIEQTYNSFANQRTPETFRRSDIRATRELTLDPDYEPDFINFPLGISEVAVDLDDEEIAYLEEIRLKRSIPGETQEEILRGAVLTWYLFTQTDGLGDIEFVFPHLEAAS